MESKFALSKTDVANFLCLGLFITRDGIVPNKRLATILGFCIGALVGLFAKAFFPGVLALYLAANLMRTWLYVKQHENMAIQDTQAKLLLAGAATVIIALAVLQIVLLQLL